ncbi:MAG: histidine phosphatase family protein [Flavobacteriaceae bacterium]|nr:histidine phosphatase family protein [Flavobacteriaceae bacterium]
MKRIILVRHAKSSWKHDVRDHDRPLKLRGNNDAELISQHTKNCFEMPDQVISSTANRAKSTAQYFQRNWQIPDTIFSLNSEIYDFSGAALTRVIQAKGSNVNSLMIFGHNFAITYFVNTFGNLYIENVPTCGFVVIDFDIASWEQIKNGNTVYKIFPKDLKI